MHGTEEFFKTVLPSTGWFYVAAVLPDGGCKHKGYATEDAAEAHAWALADWQRRKLNTYFTPCTWTQQYTQNAEGKNKNCRQSAELVHHLRAFWLDIDSKKDGVTPKESLKALAKFCLETGMPMPNVVVATGGGVHVYWTFADELTLQQWQPIANALKIACAVKGLKTDPVVTADHARILRLPGSINYKYPEQPVAKLTKCGPHVDYVAFVKALGPFRDADTQDCNDEYSSKPGSVDYVKGKLGLVVQRCPLIAAVAANNGAQCDEPLWKGLLHICAHAEDGDTWAHTLSSGHPGYTVIATDRKLAACDTAFPPTRCTTLDAAYWEQPSPCKTCEHNGKIKGPLVLGRERSEGSIVRPQLMPKNYYLTKTGIYHSVEDKDGETVEERVTQLPILSIEVHDIVDHDSNDAKVVPHVQMAWLDGVSRPHKGMFPVAALPDYRTLYGHLSTIKFPYTKADHKNGFDTLMTSWIQKLRDAGDVTTGKPQFGWHFKSHDEVLGFAIGKTMYLPDGSTKIMMWPDSQLNHVYACEGNIVEWKKAVELMQRRNKPELMVLIAGAFAAPLFTFLGESSAVVSAVSRESGVGKSSALKVAQAVWGNPKIGITALDDTPKSVARKMGIIKHLPVFWDELRLTDETSQQFLQMMFQLSQGRERSRLTSSVDFRESGTWETILVCASNNHLASIAYDQNTRSNANLKRLFEYDIQFDGETPRSVDGTEIFNNLRYNYGHAGVLYAKFLVQNAKRVRTELLAMNKAMYKLVGATNADRFWVGTMVCLLMGARYASELDLVPFDLQSLKNFLLATYRGMQDTEEETVEVDTSPRLLAEFLRETSGLGIVFKGSKPGHSWVREELSIARPPADLRTGVIWEYFVGSGTLRICRQPMLDFFRKRKVSRKELMTEFTHRGYLPLEVRVALAAGTRFESLGRQYAFELTLPEEERAMVDASLKISKDADD